MKFFLARQGFVEKSSTIFHDIRAHVERQADERQLSSPEVSFLRRKGRLELSTIHLRY